MSDASTLSLPKTARPVSEALVVFCMRPATESVEELLGTPVVAAILDAPAKATPVPWRLARTAVVVLALALVAIGIFTPIALGWQMLALLAVAAMAGAPWLMNLRGILQNRRELTRTELARLTTNASQKRNLFSSEEFRRLVGGGSLQAYSVLPNGIVKPLTDRERLCFVADNGRILIVSTDHSRWMAIAARPLPEGEIWIDLGGRIARSQLTAKTLIEEQDGELYKRRMQWIRARASERGITTGALISGLAIIDALRHEDVIGKPLSKAMETVKLVLNGPAASDSAIIKMHSGNYTEFETALQALPLEDLP